MPQVTPVGETIIDYIDTLLSYNSSHNIPPPSMISLNKGEWIQLLNLQKSNLNNVASAIEMIEDGSGAKYREVHLYYDGSESTDIYSYISIMREMTELMERNRRANLGDEQAITEETADRSLRPGRIFAQGFASVPRADVPQNRTWGVATANAVRGTFA